MRTQEPANLPRVRSDLKLDGEVYTASDLVFTAEGSGPLNPTAFLRRFQRLAPDLDREHARQPPRLFDGS
jgi:hypothetical protein